MNQTTKKIVDDRGITRLFIISWLSYFVTNIGRLNYSACLSEIGTTQNIGKPELGLVATYFFFAYGIGQLLNGFLGDKMSPRFLVFTGIFMSGISNILFGFASSISQMQILWLLNGFFQSMIWSPLIKYLSNLLHGPQCLKVSVGLSTTGPVGMFAAYGLSALLIHMSGWRINFLIAGFLLVGVSILWLIGTKQINKYVEVYGVEDTFIISENPQQQNNIWSLKDIVVKSGLIIILLICFIQGVLKDGINVWIPSYFSEAFSISPSVSSGISMILPIINVAGVFFSKWLNDKKFNGEMSTASFLFMLTCTSLLLMLFTGNSLIFSFILLAIMSTCIGGINTVATSIMPIHFVKTGRLSTIVGLSNSVIYLGSGIAGYVFGVLSEQYGWNIVKVSWLILGLLAIVLSFTEIKIWNKFTKS